MKHIILYWDDFKTDVWHNYCDICQVPYTTEKLIINFSLDNVKGE